MDNLRNYPSLQATIANGAPEDVDVILERAGEIRLVAMTLTGAAADREDYWDRFGEIAEFLYGVTVPGGRMAIHTPAWAEGRGAYLPDRIRMAVAARGWTFIDEIVMSTGARDRPPGDRVTMNTHDFFLAFARDAGEGERPHATRPGEGEVRAGSLIVTPRNHAEWPPTSPPMVAAWQAVFRAYSSPGDLICDPLCIYAGTTIAAALQGSAIVAACPGEEAYRTTVSQIDDEHEAIVAMIKRALTHG